jgi:hypothetical protein
MTEYKIENLRNKAFHGSTVDDEFWTIECLVDKLFLRLAEVKENVNNNGKEIHVRKYYRQARELFKWIPIAKPSPPFIICISDLTPRLKEELEHLITAPESLGYVLNQAVGRIFENLDSERYHMITARKLLVGFER